MRKEKVVVVDDKNLHLVFGFNFKSWDLTFGLNEDLWDFPIEELLDGTIEINEDIWYWFIDGRCYETTELV